MPRDEPEYGRSILEDELRRLFQQQVLRDLFVSLSYRPSSKREKGDSCSLEEEFFNRQPGNSPRTE